MHPHIHAAKLSLSFFPPHTHTHTHNNRHTYNKTHVMTDTYITTHTHSNNITHACTRKYAHAHTHTCTHTHTRTRTHTHTHARAHTHTHTHTHARQEQAQHLGGTAVTRGERSMSSLSLCSSATVPSPPESYCAGGSKDCLACSCCWMESLIICSSSITVSSLTVEQNTSRISPQNVQ